jgi:hypothetical protein
LREKWLLDGVGSGKEQEEMKKQNQQDQHQIQVLEQSILRYYPTSYFTLALSHGTCRRVIVTFRGTITSSIWMSKKRLRKHCKITDDSPEHTNARFIPELHTGELLYLSAPIS